MLFKKIYRLPALSDLVSFPFGNRRQKQDLGAMRKTDSRVCVSEALRWELSGFCQAGFHSTQIKPEFYLASIRNAVSQDNVWEPRVILIPCWYMVSVIYTAVENHSSSRYAALFMLMGLEHWSSWLSQKTELWFCCSFFLFRNCFSKIHLSGDH